MAASFWRSDNMPDPAGGGKWLPEIEHCCLRREDRDDAFLTTSLFFYIMVSTNIPTHFGFIIQFLCSY